MLRNWFQYLKIGFRRIRIIQSYKKRHKAVYGNGQLVISKLTSKEKRQYVEKWSVISKHVNLDSVTISKSLTGVFNVNIVPEEIFSHRIEPFLNRNKNVTFIETKNLYNKWFGEGIFPRDYLHKIDGIYYDSDLSVISDVKSFLEKSNLVFPLVFKPSIDSYGGANVFFLNNKAEICDKMDLFRDFVLQEKIVQHQLINNINAGSINTVRVCLYKSRKDHKFHVLNCSLRMGKDGSLDNETAGGIVCNIKKGGFFNNFAVDKVAKKYFKHPNSNFVFEDGMCPNYMGLIENSIKIAERVVFANLISLDMCLDSDNTWRCIEINLMGQTIRFSQYAGTAFFEEFTDEVIKELKEKSNKI